MHRWGHIGCFRFDNGLPFGDPQKVRRTPCALNLVARGCGVVINPVCTPTRNAKVERCQGTTGRWGDAGSCENIEEFAQALEYAVTAQRERLKTRVCKGRARMEFHPGLATNPRKYDGQDFDLHRVFKYLERGLWHRRVSKVGQTVIFGKKYQVGFQFRNQPITIKCKVIDSKPYWLCFDEQQVLIKNLLAQNIWDGSYLDLSIMSKN
jgi:hypothetical protein